MSQSTRYDPDTESVITYDKHNVFAMQLDGGEDYYRGPHLHEYIVSAVKSLVPALTEEFPEAMINAHMISNKLAVCTGGGSSYDKHYDNSGLNDVRKVTVLLYLNEWRPELGGQFRVFGLENEVTDIEPKAGRLLVFWSDLLVHSVLASEAPSGTNDHRYALTVWLSCDSPANIVRDNNEIERHFGRGVV